MLAGKSTERDFSLRAQALGIGKVSASPKLYCAQCIAFVVVHCQTETSLQHHVLNSIL